MRRGVVIGWLLVTCGMACNAILGNHDRTLEDTEDGATPKPPGKDGATDTSVPDMSSGGIDADVDVEAGPVIIKIDPNFTTPNGALFRKVDGGTQINGYTDAGHAVIVPAVQPAIPENDYTLVATVRAPSNSEFGILARGENNQDFVLLGSKFGAENKAFIGWMSAPEWSPYLYDLGPLYTYQANARYGMKLRVVGSELKSKFWNMSSPEPTDFNPIGARDGGSITGKGVGFYIYGAFDAVLEAMHIEIP